MHAAAPETLEYDPGPHKLQAATLDAPDTVDQQTIRAFPIQRLHVTVIRVEHAEAGGFG